MKKIFSLLSVLLFSQAFSEEVNSDTGFQPEEKLICAEEDKLARVRSQLVAKNRELIERERELLEKYNEYDCEETCVLEDTIYLTNDVGVLIDIKKQLIAKEKELIRKSREFTAKESEQCLVEGQVAQAQTDQQNQPDNSQPAKEEDSERCHSPFRVFHGGLRHTEGRGVGYKDGYTTLEGFGIYDRNSSWMPFVDLRGHVFDNGKLAGNAGVGLRSYLSSISHVFGVYLYYDVRQGSRHLTPQQLSPGVELLGKRMEYRANGYFPIGNTKSQGYDFAFEKFDGHHIILKGRQKRVMTGGDAEVGAHLTQSTKYDLYAGVGPYYFTASDRSAWGGKARLLGRYKQYLSLEASYSYDRLFKNVVQGSIAFNLPFGHKIRRKGENCSDRVNLALGRAAFAPYRFEIPVVKKITQKQKAIRPSTNRPWKVWFVDNTSSSSGTFKSPFPTLVQAQDASSKREMIYVFPGDGTTTGMDMGITLKSGQKLFGSGISHQIRTTQGKIRIPSFSSTAPKLSNAGSIVVLANGNEVSGFDLLVTQANSIAIQGTAAIHNTNINRNIISGNVQHTGIHLIGGGTLSVENNQIFGPSFAGVVENRGIFLEFLEEADLDIDISENTISGFLRGMEITGIINPILASGTTKISKNNVSGFSQFGIDYSTGMADSICTIKKNTVLNNVGTPVSRSIAVIVNDRPNAGTVFVTKNDVRNTTAANATSGILTEINVAVDTSAHIILSDNAILVGSGVNSEGILIRTMPMNTLCETLTGNVVQLQAPGTFGMQIISNGTLNFDEISNNVIPSITISGAGTVNFVPSCP